MTYPVMAKSAGRVVNDAINREFARQEELAMEISASERSVVALTVLLRFCECQKCGAELEGGVQAAEEMAAAAKIVGRLDVPCAFCDTPEQQEAFSKALDQVSR